MYSSIEIKGFRCFKHLTIPKLARLNLIGGKNNTGKTALLEAVRVLADGWAHSDRVLSDLYRLRGLDEVALRVLRFEDVISGFAKSGGASIAASDPGQPADVLVELEVGNAHDPRAGPGRQALVKHAGRGQSRVLLTDSGDTVRDEAKDGYPPCGFLPAREHLPREGLASLFSAVRAGNLDRYALRALEHIDRRVERLELLAPGGAPLLHADIGEGRLVPIPLVGEGMSRACTLMLALCNAAGGFLLVDEVENGLHHSVMPDVWRAIAQAATDLDVQVFATTHSYECVEAAREATQDMPEGTFLYHRLDRTDEGIRCVTYDAETLDAALQMPWEVR